MVGYITLHRKIKEHWIFDDPVLFKLWVTMLLDAKFSDTERRVNGAVVSIKRGQLVFGLEQWSREHKVTCSKLRTLLKNLEKCGMISRQKTNKYSLITITNYDEYQIGDRQSAGKGQAKGRQKAGSEESKEGEEGKQGSPQKSAPVSIDGFLRRCKDSGEQPIPEDHKVFEYAEDVGIPLDLLRLCWLEFVEQMQGKGKRYKDWRAAFLNYVRNNYLKLWFIDNGQYLLTTQGKQAQIKHRGKL
ncbi:hypothetical protein [Litorivivens sp.]|uniref:hypothetical protein n=1 Tax=Litorivivens sp. TaxID=2020868 RepID=UPI003568261A